jgi:hypothetical protein
MSSCSLACGPGERCALCSQSVASRFRDPSINRFLASLFTTISTWSTHQPELPRVTLSRYDLFHAHLFWGPHPTYPAAPNYDYVTHSITTQGTSDSGTLHGTRSQPAPPHLPPGGLGLLFHCAEYVQYDEDRFPYQLGYCQVGSGVINWFA